MSSSAVVLAGHPSPEARLRLEEILKSRKEFLLSARQLQMVRATEVLENIGTKEARNVLETLARGTAGFSITQDAQAALERLSKRAPGP